MIPSSACIEPGTRHRREVARDVDVVPGLEHAEAARVGSGRAHEHDAGEPVDA